MFGYRSRQAVQDGHALAGQGDPGIGHQALDGIAVISQALPQGFDEALVDLEIGSSGRCTMRRKALR